MSRRIAANTGLLLVAKILAVGLGLVTILIATQTLSTAEFGIVVFLHAYMLFFAEVATFQSWQSLIRFGTDHIRDENAGALSKLIRFCVSIDILSVVLAYGASVLFFTLVVFISNMLGSGDIADGYNIEDLRGLAAVYCLVIFSRLNSTPTGLFRLFDKFNVLAIEALILPVARFVGVIVALWLDLGIIGFVAAWFFGSLCQYLFLVVMGVIELHKRCLLGMSLRNGVSLRAPQSNIWPFMIKSNIDSTLATGNMHLPQLMVMAMFGPVWNAIFKIAEEVAKLLTEAFKLLDQVIYPELAKLISLGQADKIWAITMRAAAILLAIGLSFSALILIFGETALIYVFGDDYGASAPLASLLVPAAALMGVAAPLFPIFYAADRPEQAIYVRGGGLLIYTISFIIFGVTIGRMAPGWAALVANFVLVCVLGVVARRTINKTVKRARIL